MAPMVLTAPWSDSHTGGGTQRTWGEDGWVSGSRIVFMCGCVRLQIGSFGQQALELAEAASTGKTSAGWTPHGTHGSDQTVQIGILVLS